jgi:hypothetical protein
MLVQMVLSSIESAFLCDKQNVTANSAKDAQRVAKVTRVRISNGGDFCFGP